MCEALDSASSAAKMMIITILNGSRGHYLCCNSVPILVPKWFFIIQILRISVSIKLQCMLWSRSLKTNLLELLLYQGMLRVSLGSCRFQVGGPKPEWCSEVNSTGRSSRGRGSSSRGSAHLWPPWHQAHTRCTGMHADIQNTHMCWLNMWLMQCLREITCKVLTEHNLIRMTSSKCQSGICEYRRWGLQTPSKTLSSSLYPWSIHYLLIISWYIKKIWQK